MKFKLLTTAIVSAIHPNEPARVGSVWEPKSAPDISEAEALQAIGYAEQTKEKVSVGNYGDAKVAKTAEEIEAEEAAAADAVAAAEAEALAAGAKHAGKGK